MQLNMVTPMDIGLERQDGIDDSDMFDLGEVEGKRQRGSGRPLQGDFGVNEDESGDEGSDESGLDAVAEEEEDEDSDGLDDEERKTQRLEDSLDQLYDQFHARKTERDAKHRAKEEKRKRDAAEGGEWHGIKAVESEDEDSGDNDPAPAPDSDDQDTEDEELSGAGGMEVGDGAEEDEDVADVSSFSTAVEAPRMSKRAAKAAATLEQKRARKAASSLITSLVIPVAEDKIAEVKSKAAKQWFDQPVFKGLAGLEELMKGEASEEEDLDEEDDDESAAVDVSGVWEAMGSEDEAAEAAALTVRSLLLPSCTSLTDMAGLRGPGGSRRRRVGRRLCGRGREARRGPRDGCRGRLPGARGRRGSSSRAHRQYVPSSSRAKFRLTILAELGLTTAQAMTMAQQLVNRERTKTQMIDEGFNRHAYNTGGDGLPTWFLDDEQKHFRNNIPVTKEAVEAIREKLRALNARPIKKIAEAQARKKMRTIRRIEKTRAKTQGINDDEDNGLTEKEKASSIAKVLAKSAGSAKPKRREVKLVVARGTNRGNQGRPKGVSGRYKMVDPRLKKVRLPLLRSSFSADSSATSGSPCAQKDREARSQKRRKEKGQQVIPLPLVSLQFSLVVPHPVCPSGRGEMHRDRIGKAKKRRNAKKGIRLAQRPNPPACAPSYAPRVTLSCSRPKVQGRVHADRERRGRGGVMYSEGGGPATAHKFGCSGRWR